jgi:protein farnesyltransferase subunit beta
MSDNVISLISASQHPTGGFGGGPYQIPHLATTYAAVSALVCIGTPEALSVIDRPKLRRFIESMKDEQTGGFRMHEGGETDVRGTYCAIAVASLVQILDNTLTEGVGDYVRRCQTYEGGIAGEPGMEAHGGYSYCGLAALAIMGEVENFIDISAFTDWLCRRQMALEGGFNGRANKLVDSCYTFWQGASFPILADLERLKGARKAPVMFSVELAQMYVVLACQTDQTGGLRDKPGKPCDFYHTCYALSGLAALQHPTNDLRQRIVIGNESVNLLERNCVLYNNTIARVDFARDFFNNQPQLGTEGKGAVAVYALAHHLSSH